MVVLGSTGSISSLGDFDGDGIPDLIGAADLNGSLGVLYGKGDGTFLPGQTISEPAPIWPDSGAPYFTMGWHALAADVDGDGLLDLVSATNGDTAIRVRRGLGSRTTPFGEPTRYPTTGGIFRIVLADFDNDGRLDLVSGEDHGLEYWRAIIDGQFEHQAFLASGDGLLGGQGGIGSILPVDWNGDGLLDLVYGAGGFGTAGYGAIWGGSLLGAGWRLNYRLGRGDGTFDAEVACALTMGIVGDFDHDNRPDLISASSIKGATLSLGINGCGASKVVPITDWTKQGGVALADFNGDGNLDVVIDDNKAIMVHVGDGQGGFPHALTFPAPNIGQWPLGSFLVGDLNRDGKLDIVFARDGGWGVLLNTCQ